MPDNQSDPHRSRLSTKSLCLVLGLVWGALFLIWLLNTPPGLLGKTDAVGYAVCHRIATHSFYLAERPFSLCARCTGQYLGFLGGFIYQLIAARSRFGFPRRFTLLILGFLGLIYLVDGVNSALHLYPGLENYAIYEPHNTLRLFTGLGVGVGVSAILYPLSGQAVWKEISTQPAFGRPRDWLILGGGTLLVGGMVLSENPLILYPLILLSTAGLLLILVTLYTVIWVLVSKRENTFKTWRELSAWVLMGSISALIQIMGVDFLRYLLTGTWSGFLDY
jgi:uncharacterized membrane protein